MLEKERRSKLLKHFQRQVRYFEKRTGFWTERQCSFWNVLHVRFLAKSAMQTSVSVSLHVLFGALDFHAIVA